MKLSWFTVYFITLIWSTVNPVDYFTWFLESLPAIIGLVILVVSYKKSHLDASLIKLFINQSY